MTQYVIKRNAEKMAFDSSKITQAIASAGKATNQFDEEIAKHLTLKVLTVLQQLYQEAEIPLVETIQDIVEEVLLTSPYKKTAKAYILYREQRANMRRLINQNKLELMDQYLEKKDWQVKENSNMSYSLQGLNNYVTNEVSKIYWLNKIYSPEIRDAHQSGDFHLHDLGQISVYCVGWDLQDLLRVGFQGVRGKVESKPAKHFRTALGQMVNFFYTLQGESAGAQAFANVDTLLAPFIYYDGLQYDQVKQALQEFVFNVNVPTRVGFQSPFTNITLDLQAPKHLADISVVVGGELRDKTYSEFQNEMDVFNRAFLEVMTEGDASGRVFTFPIPTYNITEDFDWENPNLELLWKVTAKYGIPYFANFVNSDMSPDDARSMCCRLRIDNRELSKRGGGLFGASPLTGSIGVVTINLPRIGFLSHSKAEFFERLQYLMDLAKRSLLIKRKTLEDFTERGLYPYAKFYLRDIKERRKEYWSNHFSTIGIVGMNEACEHLLGVNLGDTKGIQFAEDVLDFMRERLLRYQEEEDVMFNLEATPAESTAYRFCRLDVEKYAQMFDDQSLKLYTNSSQLPVDFTEDVFEMLDLQDGLQTKYTGGTVLHIYLGEAVADPNSVKQFIKKVCHQYELPYISLTPTFSICPVHGYLLGEQTTCPQCGERTEVYSRVVGYLRPVDQWNEGKQGEYLRRKKFSVSL